MNLSTYYSIKILKRPEFTAKPQEAAVVNLSPVGVLLNELRAQVINANLDSISNFLYLVHG